MERVIGRVQPIKDHPCSLVCQKQMIFTPYQTQVKIPTLIIEINSDILIQKKIKGGTCLQSASKTSEKGEREYKIVYCILSHSILCIVFVCF